jgi:thiamine-monophosphate kinase
MMRAAGALPKGYSEIGDDVAAVPVEKGKAILKADMLVEGTDMPAGMTYRQAARKAVAMCVSDFASKGVRPTCFLVSLGLRNGVSESQVDEIAAGIRDSEREWGAKLVGGDTNEAKELVIDCLMLGFAGKYVHRAGAKVGETLIVTGEFGYPPAGLKILGGGKSVPSSFAKKAKRSVLYPEPNLELGLALGRHLSSAMDSSDGLARSLHTLARASGVGFEITKVPEAKGLKDFARMNSLDPLDLVMDGGEEYLIVGTMNSSRVDRATKDAERAGGKIIAIGKVTSRREVVLRKGTRTVKIPDEGWTHLA